MDSVRPGCQCATLRTSMLHVPMPARKAWHARASSTSTDLSIRQITYRVPELEELGDSAAALHVAIGGRLQPRDVLCPPGHDLRLPFNRPHEVIEPLLPEQELLH